MSCFGHPCFPIISKSATIVLYKGDVGTDIYSAVRYLEEGHEWWGYLNIAFTVCPIILVAPWVCIIACGKDKLCLALLSIICFPLAPVGILYWNLILAIKDCRRGNKGSKSNDSKSATNKDNDSNTSNDSYPDDSSVVNNDQCSVPLQISGSGEFTPSAPGPGDFVPSAPGPGDFVPSAPPKRGPDTDNISKVSNDSTPDHVHAVTITTPVTIVPKQVPDSALGPREFVPSAPPQRGPDIDNISMVSNDSTPDHAYAVTITTPVTIVPKQVPDNDNISNSSNDSCPENKSTTSNDKINSDIKDNPVEPAPDHVVADAYMKIVDSVTESLPQSCLSMHIIFQTVEKHGLDGVEAFQWITLIFSLVSLAFSLTTNYFFNHGYGFKGKAVTFLLFLPTITSRLMVCSTYSAVHPGLWFIPIGTEVIIWIIIVCCGLFSSIYVHAVAASLNIWYAIGGLYIALPRVITITSLVLNIVMAIIQLFISSLEVK